MIEFGEEYKALSYHIFTKQDVTGTAFNFSFGNTGSAYPFVYFYGESGKLYDQEDNYFGSYRSYESISISGNVFSGHHNYFYKGDLIHDSCQRTGVGSGINAFFDNNLYTGYGISVAASDSF
jgi:hypothetical protein